MRSILPRSAAALVRAAVLTALVTLALPPAADAQGIGGRLKNKLKQKAEERTEQVLDKTAEAADQAVTCVVTDSACIAAAKENGQPVAYTDEDGNPVPEPATAAASTSKPGEGAWANFDFVPGERVIFAEDFTRDRVGNFPQRLEFIDGNMEVVDWNGRRWLRANPGGTFQIPLPEILPDRFTIEFDVTVPWESMHLWGAPVGDDGHGATAWIEVSGSDVGIIRGGNAGRATVDPRTISETIAQQFDAGYLSDPVRIRVMADGSYVKVYMNEHRVSNMPNADFARTATLSLKFYENTEGPPLITDIVVAASDVTLYDALLADGRVATQGILFDTGSDRIRPESSGTLAEIAAMLSQHPDLGLVIEGHTDNVGDAAANQVLSEKRAAAVKAALVSSYGVGGERLETGGFGASKPVADNGTPEGRQQNRRVELVKR